MTGRHSKAWVIKSEIWPTEMICSRVNILILACFQLNPMIWSWSISRSLCICVFPKGMGRTTCWISLSGSSLSRQKGNNCILTGSHFKASFKLKNVWERPMTKLSCLCCLQVLFKIGVGMEENLKEPSTCLFTAQGDWGTKDPLKFSRSTRYSNSNIQEQLQTFGGGWGSFLPVSTWQITVVVSLWSFYFHW